MNTRLQSLLLAVAKAAMILLPLLVVVGCDKPPSSSSNATIQTPNPGERLAALAGISGTYFEGFYGEDPETLTAVSVTLMRYSDSAYWNGLTWGALVDLPATHVATAGQYGTWQLAPGTALPTGDDPATGLVDGFYCITVASTFSGRQHQGVSLFSVGASAPPVLPAPWAWGDNHLGQMGWGGPVASSSPKGVYTYGALDGKIVATLAGGGGHSLALTSDGLVYAWGSNSYGQLGASPVPPPDPYGSRFWQPVKVDATVALSGERIVSIAAGSSHSLAASFDGEIFAWGSDDSGQIGDGGTFGSGVKAEAPVTVAGQLAGKHVIAVSAGSSHSLALTDDADGRKLYTWGVVDYVEYTDAADGNISHFSPAPVAVAGLSGVRIAAISCGSYHNLAITDDGKLYAWGRNVDGQLGTGSFSPSYSNTPSLVAGPWGTKRITACAANRHSLAVDEDGKVYAWGSNLQGELGIGDQTFRSSPVEVAGLAGHVVTQVAAGSFYSLARTNDNKVFSWGDNRDGQLARYAPPYDYAPNPGEADLSAPLAGGRVILGLAAGYGHALLLSGLDPDAKPEIEVEAQGVELADGGSIDFGAVGQGSSNLIFIKVRNAGATGSYLKDLSASVSGTGFSGIFTAPPLATGDDTGFYVTFNPNTAGAASGTVQIFSDDADENPFDITLTGSAYPIGQVDLPFDPGVTGDVYGTAVQPDGMAVVTGSFVQVNAPSAPVARNRAARVLGATGVADAFNPDLNSFSYCSAVLPDGKIMVGGAFTTVGGVARNRLARLNPDGTLDTTFDAQITFSGTVYAMALQADGKLVVAGNFSGIGGGTQPNLARLNADGTLDTGFTPVLNSSGRSVAVQADGNIVISGLFTSVNGQGFNRLARVSGIDGSLDPTFTNPNIVTSSNIECVAVQGDGKILVCGNAVMTIDGQTRNGIARLNANGTLDTGFDPDVGGTFPQVTSIVVRADKRILIGGNFTSVGGQTRNRIAMLLPNGQLEQFFDPNANSGVLSLALQADGKILAGGGFSSIGGEARSKLARLSNDVATQSLSVADNNSRIEWLRGGSSPETNLVAFDVSSDGGTTWTPLGPATRVTFPSPGWQLTGAALPPTGHIRARAYPQGGRYNGSVSCLETITSYGTPPDIVVTENSISLSSGFMRDFGVVATGRSSSVMQLTLQNGGGTTLTGLSGVTIEDDLSVAGDHTSQFQLGKPAAISLAPGATTTMTVTYKPRASVTTIDQPGSDARHWAWLRIPSNDSDENPFNIHLTGMGGLPFTTYKEQDNGDSASPDTDDSDGNGQSDLQEYATRTTAASTDGDGTSIQPPSGGGGSFAPATFAGENEAGDPPPEPTFLFHYRRNKLALADVIFQVEWSDTLAENDWHTTGVTEIILSDDDSIQQMQATVPAGSAGRRFARLKMTRP